MTFAELSLHPRLQRAIATAGFTAPTPIQAAAIPVALTGHDLIGVAQTGTGKTAAFVLPLLHRLLTTPATSRKMRALVLTPTRELAEQTRAFVRQLGHHTNLRVATIYGGVGIALQERALRNGTEIIVACPGRFLDHVERGNVDASQVECLVLDEADRMLDMGFLPDVARIIELLPAARQTMFFSATFGPTLTEFVERYLHDPVRLAVDAAAPAETIAHALYPVPAHMKTALLVQLLRTLDARSVLIFTRTKDRADQVAEQLTHKGFPVGVLHADRTQSQRQQVMEAFRTGAYRYLVATDLAARGLDVAAISHVINYDIPATADDYIHRIGRTGRATRSGEALTLVTLHDARTIRDIERTLGEELDTRFLDGFDYRQLVAAATQQTHAARPAAKGRAPRPPKRSEAHQLSADLQSLTAKAAHPAKPARKHHPRPAGKATSPAKKPHGSKPGRKTC